MTDRSIPQKNQKERFDSNPIKLNFPRIIDAELRGFSLFTLETVIDVQFSEGVFCLVGANGLGKSTFLATMNFAATGIVPEPGRRFMSVPSYYKHSLSFADEYFSGRIAEKDRETAEVSLRLSIGDHEYFLTRSVFESDELRALTINKVTPAGTRTILDGTKLSSQDRHKQYKAHITKDIGLATFEQFVFLQHFLLTFDERRHLLLWNEDELVQTLYLAFGVDHADADKADSLRDESEKSDSRARNFNWQATEIRKKIKELQQMTQVDPSPPSVIDLVELHKRKMFEEENTRQTVLRLEGVLRDSNLRLASLSSKQVAIRSEYNDEFSRRIQTQTHIKYHPLVVQSLNENKCGLCGAFGTSIASAITSKVSSESCPLCDSAVNTKQASPESKDRLRSLDKEIAETRNQLEDIVHTIQRLTAELQKASADHAIALKEVQQFESDNRVALLQIHDHKPERREDSVESIIEAYEKQMNELLSRKDTEYKRRDEQRKELRKLQESLERRYAIAEGEFVPLFKELAFQFLGIDLDIRMESRSSPGLSLLVEVRNETRRKHHQLSESQKFFLDIALRMALVQFMSNQQGRATLFVDTPEGSLDIAYESRAGNMLANFAKRGFRIFMTANINSSHLLLSLASELGREKMHVCRMTSWTELSEVQIQEEELFERAYAAIETSLDSRERV